jgi:putative transposase
MPRTARYAPGGLVYHVLNRGVGRRTLFESSGDYLAFEHVLEETLRILPLRVCAYALMPNHWHFVLWPERDGELAAFMRQLTNTHVKRWQAYRGSVGDGHLYQGRYKSFPVQSDEHFYDVVRYVERNPLRACLADAAENWRWSSLGRDRQSSIKLAQILDDWPLPRPSDWLEIVNRVQSEAELAAVRHSIRRSCPYGNDPWVERTAEQLGLASTLRPYGRPRRPK